MRVEPTGLPKLKVSIGVKRLAADFGSTECKGDNVDETYLKNATE